MAVRVSDNNRFLQHRDGTPFFYLADTAWELFHRLSYDEASDYLQDRAAKGFTAIQCVALAELDGVRTPNRNGDTPFIGDDPAKPNEAYWLHVDRVVARIAELGMVAALLPTWGDKWNKGGWGVGPEIFTPETARAYGQWIGERYKNAPALIWVLGGDRKIESNEHREIIRAMAAGIAHGDNKAHLQTFHPQGQFTSSTEFHDDDWLAFNMYQTGHSYDRDNYRSIAEDYALDPPKPCLDSEPGYEDHPNAFNRETGYMDDYECRKFLWWATLAGACGHTYGCHDIWQFFGATPAPGVNFPRTPWRDAMGLPGAAQMQHGKNALLARSYFSRVPDQSVVVSDTFDGEQVRTHHIQASRCENGAYVLVYSASGQPFTVDMTKLRGSATGAWLNPRTSTIKECGTFDNAGTQEFVPPSKGRGSDWVLTLDVV